MKKFIKKSFKRELLVCFLVVTLLPLVLSSIFLIQLFKMKVSGDYQRKNAVQETMITDKLEHLFEEFDRISQELAGSTIVQNILMENSGERESRIYSLLYEKSEEIRTMAQVELYASDGSCCYSTGTGTLQDGLPTYWGILRAARGEDKLVLGRVINNEQDKDVVLRGARCVYEKESGCVGYVVISMTRSHFDEALKGEIGGQDGICILDGFWETVYSSGTARQENIGEILRSRRMAGGSLLEDYRDNSVYLADLEKSGFTVVLMRPVAFTKDTVRTMYTVSFVLAVASGILCAVVAVKMSNHLSRPIGVLNRSMQKLQEGNLQTRITTKRTDEFATLTDNFNVMAKALENYTESQVRQQKQLDDVRIAMMQAQLNPHFLYNTLDTMKWVAKANHVPGLATLASKLAKILRTSISKEQFITLGEEIEMVKSYAEIQSIRFEGKFRFIYEIEEETADCMIPKLIVQPIVENAVLHGLSECEEGDIRVTAQRKEDELVISVTDSGQGMDEEFLRCINGRAWDKISGHIGLFNVDTIIRLHYGGQYGVKAMNLQEGGCQVRVQLPLDRRKEQENVEGIGGR